MWFKNVVSTAMKEHKESMADEEPQTYCAWLYPGLSQGSSGHQRSIFTSPEKHREAQWPSGNLTQEPQPKYPSVKGGGVKGRCSPEPFRLMRVAAQVLRTIIRYSGRAFWGGTRWIWDI